MTIVVSNAQCVCAAFTGCGTWSMQTGHTALTLAAKEGHTECVRLLLESGADKDAAPTVRVRNASGLFGSQGWRRRLQSVQSRFYPFSCNQFVFSQWHLLFRFVLRSLSALMLLILVSSLILALWSLS